MPIPPDSLHVQCIVNVLKRITLDKYKIRFAANGNKTSVLESKSPCVDTGSRTECFFGCKATMFREVVQLQVQREAPGCTVCWACRV